MSNNKMATVRTQAPTYDALVKEPISHLWDNCFSVYFIGKMWPSFRY